MTERLWEIIKTMYCDHAGCQVSLEAEVVYPVEWMPEQPARVLSHRCSHGYECSLYNQPTCIWAGTNPSHDPYNLKE